MVVCFHPFSQHCVSIERANGFFLRDVGRCGRESGSFNVLQCDARYKGEGFGSEVAIPLDMLKRNHPSSDEGIAGIASTIYVVKLLQEFNRRLVSVPEQLKIFLQWSVVGLDRRKCLK